MKKTYINPEMMIVPLKSRNSLLAGSIKDEGNGSYSVGFFGDKQEGDVDEDI